MNITEILTDVEYLKEGPQIIATHKTHGHALVADMRMFGYLCNVLGDRDKAVAMQDKLGKFIEEAINEKVEREKKHIKTATIKGETLPITQLNTPIVP